MIILKILFVLLVLIMMFHLLTRKYCNPYKLIMIFGKKGSGKTTNLTKIALSHVKKGWKVYCTDKIPGTYYISSDLIGKVQIPPNSLLLIDEVGMIYDNRHYKDFPTHVRDWFKLQRHYKVKVIMFSQTFDVDLKLRNLTDELFLVNNKFRVFSYGKRIKRNIVITRPTGDMPSTIADELKFDSLLWFLFGSRFLTFIPKYTKYFDSFEAPKLRDCNFTYTEIKKHIKTKNKKKRGKKKWDLKFWVFKK